MHHFLHIVNDWVQDFGRSFPSSVEIATRQWASVVAVDDAVGVQHGDDFEHEVVSEYLCLRIVRVGQKIEDTLHHPWADRLTRMHSRSQYHTLLRLRLLLILILTRYDQVITLITSQSSSQVPDHTQLAPLRVTLNSLQILFEISIRVRVTICKIYLVIIIFKVIGEGQCVVWLVILLVHSPDGTVGVVQNLVSASVPPDVCLLHVLFTINQNFHSVVEKGIRFGEVEHVESHWCSFFGVANTEKEPLGVASSVNVVLYDEVVIVVSNLDGWVEVARFKPTFKDQSVVVRTSRCVVWFNRTSIDQGLPRCFCLFWIGLMTLE